MFLDLGSSGGLVVIEAARENWAAYGIDLCQRCCSFARECICKAEKVGYIPKDRAIISEGNFFPPHFQVIRSRGDEDPFKSPIIEHQRVSTSDDPYGRLGVALQNVNLFFHYQVERRDNILRFFAQEAQSGARLLVLRSLNDLFTLHSNVELESEWDATELYQKK